MDATLIGSTFSDRSLMDAEWGPARREIARSAADDTTLDQRDAALAWPEAN